MEPSHNFSKDQRWAMKDAAKHVGAGLPRLYERLREKGLFTKMGIDGRNMPTTKLVKEGYFCVEAKAWFDKSCNTWRPCPHLEATYHGLMLLQEIADELAREKAESPGKRSRVPDKNHGDKLPSEVHRDSAEHGRAASCGGEKTGGDGPVREPPQEEIPSTPASATTDESGQTLKELRALFQEPDSNNQQPTAPGFGDTHAHTS